MKYLILIPLAAAVLWIAYLFLTNRRKSPYESSGNGGDSGGGSSNCTSGDGSCGGDGGGD